MGCGDDGGLPALTDAVSLACPMPGALPFRTATTGFQNADNPTFINSGHARDKDEASDTLGNPSGMSANIYLPDGATAVASRSYHGDKARTGDGNGLFGQALPGENVSLWSYDPAAMAWSQLASGTTGDDGYYEIAAGAVVAPYGQPIYAMLEADGSCAEHYDALLPAGSKVVVTDIDGTLTTDDNEEFKQVADATYTPLMNTAANTMAQAWAAKGYPVIYLTARPHVLRVESRGWLRDKAFPNGPLITANAVENANPYKTMWLERMIVQFGWIPVAAYGNADTDIAAYANAGIAKDITFIIGPLAGQSGTVAIPNNDFTAHIAGFIASQPANH